ncbi:MAG TPA: DinB family protein [Blastocatellia bacterium]|nr:DinB family protein [Blastocatellia bacterium]
MPLSKKVQEIVDSINADRQALLASIEGLSQSQLQYTAADGQWSIEDILHHLAISDEANGKLMGGMLKKAESLNLDPDPSPDGSELHSLDGFADALKTRAQAPDFVTPRSHLPAEESLARLASSRDRMLGAVDQLGKYDLYQLTYPHPLLGNLNLYQWLIIAGRHEARHAAQIKRIKAEPEFPKG